MPPRRSSRAPSVAPETSETLPAKRKRGQSTQSEETTAKPPSRAGSRASTSKARTSARTRSSLPDVVESGDEEEDVAPAKKKSRPSVEADVKEEDEDEEAEPPSKGRRRGKMATDEPEPLPKRRTSSRQSSVGPSRRPSAASTSRPTRKTRVSSLAESVPEEDEGEDEEEEKPKPKRRVGRKVVKEEPVSDEEAQEPAQDDDDREEDVVSTQKGRKGKAPARQTKGAAQEKVVVVTSDEDDDDLTPPPASPSKATPKKPVAEEPEPEQEEEQSLLDPPPMPDPATLPKVMPEEPQGPKSRLVISKMALVNFKSYAGRQEIGPFHKSFSAIVGPNGSGKSNTIDALLFVFGYRASKMRQGKVSELIHNSARYPNLEKCSVEIHFRDIIDLPGPDAYEVVPGSKLVVARTAYKNNKSDYTINGKTASYKEVQTLLKSRGIDLDHNRFLILQGEVESIAQMKPKAQTEHEDGLLEYLEDIIGTSQYKEKIETAFAEVEQLQEERQVKMNRLRLVEKEKQALEDARREAINFYKLKNDHIRAQSRYLQWLIWKLMETQTAEEAELEKLNKKLEDEAAKHEDEIKYVAELTQHYADREKQYEEVSKEMEKAVKELKETEKVAVGVKERQKHAKTRRKKLEKSVQEDTTALRNAQHLITDSGERLDKNTANLEQYREELVEAEAELEKIQDGLRGKTAKFHKQIEQKQKELEPWTNKIDAKKTQLDVAQSERDTLVQRGEALKQAVAEAQETYKNLQEEQQEKLREQAECRTEKEKLKQLIAAATAKKQAAQKDVEEWRAKANSARSRVEEAKANQSANRSRSALLESLHSLKEQGRIHGFHGKLGDLGTIDDKYDVAISTAAGGSLANLIVDKVEQGRECIEYLRTNNLGRASFMILEKLSESPRMKKINTPEDVPRLFDLVKPKDPIYRKAFYKALGDTLVAQDTTQANRIAFGGSQRWRVVTLDGALIETSGAMSGGGAQPQRGAMNSKLATDVSPQQMRQWEKSSAEAAEMLQKAFREQQEADSELEKLQRAGPELDMRYQKLTLELETRKVRIAEAAKRFEDLKAQNKPNANDAARIRELEKQIEVHTASLEELQESADKITEAIQGLEREILKIGGAQLMLQKSKVEGLRTHIGLANEAIAKAETERNKATADVKRLTASVEANEKALVEVKEELAKLDEEVEEAEEFLTALRKTVEEAQNKTENQKDELDEIKQDLANAEEGLAKFKKKELEIKNKITDTKKIIDNCQEQIDDCTDRHDKLKLHDIDEEEDDSDDEEDGEHADGEGDGEGHDDGEGEPNIKPDPDAPPKQSEQLKLYGEDELRKMRKDALLADTELLDEKIKNSKVDLTVLKEYKKQQALFDNRAKELEEVTQQRDAKKAEYDGLRKQRLEEFMTGFNLISMKLKEMYQMITLGGNAELELVDSMDPFSEGIIFSVMPPKKSWKNISNLSGGEKTLSSLALVFALHVYKPTPLYFMDEIDAALDFRNVSIVANYIKDRTKNAQFIIISLRNDMFELSHRLIGIYKTNNATRSISIDNHKLLPTAPQQSTAAA